MNFLSFLWQTYLAIFYRVAVKRDPIQPKKTKKVKKTLKMKILRKKVQIFFPPILWVSKKISKMANLVGGMGGEEGAYKMSLPGLCWPFFPFFCGKLKSIDWGKSNKKLWVTFFKFDYLVVFFKFENVEFFYHFTDWIIIKKKQKMQSDFFLLVCFLAV